MYLEVRETLKKIEQLLKLNVFQLNEIEHILFEFWSTAYNQGVEDSLPLEKNKE